MNRDSVLKYMGCHDFDITVLECTGSTNDDAKVLAAKGAHEFTTVAAMRQTSGRGRMGRRFHSPESTGLYFSVILRPDMPAEDTLFITTSAAVATASAIEKLCGRQTGIKWVNDIIIDGRKVCGILTEAALEPESGRLSYAILGIGVNIIPPSGGFPEEIRNIAGALFPDGDSPTEARSILLAGILDSFHRLYTSPNKMAFLEEYRKRSVLMGKEVNVLQSDETYSAIVKGIDDRCRLIVERDSNVIILDSGEVSVRVK